MKDDEVPGRSAPELHAHSPHYAPWRMSMPEVVQFIAREREAMNNPAVWRRTGDETMPAQPVAVSRPWWRRVFDWLRGGAR